jgi:hypothetical protein
MAKVLKEAKPISSPVGEHAGTADEFEQLSCRPQARTSAELIDFLLHNKKWWLTPIILVLLAFGTLMLLAGSAPFIYTLF